MSNIMNSTCSTCGTINRNSDLFCGTCGGRLGSSTATDFTPTAPLLLSSTQPSYPTLPSRPPYPPNVPPSPKSRLIIIVSLLLLLSIVIACIGPFLYRAALTVLATPTPTATLTPTHAPASNLPNGIGVVQASDGETIGISDGRYVFDKSNPAGNLKEQAAQKLQQDDIGSALSLLSEAHNQNTSDAEALIYRENLRLRISNAQYITFLLGTILTGDADLISDGRDTLQGAYVAQQQYNSTAEQHGGVNVRILIANFGSRVEDASLVAQQIVQLTQKDKTIVGITGWVRSAQAFAALARLSSAHVPLVSTAGLANFKNISPYFFFVAAPTEMQANVGAQYATKTLLAHSAAIFVDPADDYSRSLADSFKVKFTENGNSIVATEQYTVDDAKKNPQSLATKLQDALQQHPDILYFAGYSSDVSVLLQHMQPTDPLVLGGNTLYRLGGYRDVTPGGLSHLRFTTLAYPDAWDFLGLANQKPAFFSDYAQAFGPTPSGKSAYGFTRASSGPMISYDAVLALLLASKIALNKGDAITANAIQQGLATLTALNAFQGVTGQINFGSDGNPIDKAMAIVCNKGGPFVLDAIIGQFLLNGPLLASYPARSACM